jgi:hypothetical protein
VLSTRCSVALYMPLVSTCIRQPTHMLKLQCINRLLSAAQQGSRPDILFWKVLCPASMWS